MYFFDGHNLYFNEDATYGKSWGLKDFLDNWQKDMIIVGIECGHGPGQRLGEYCPYTVDISFMKSILKKFLNTLPFLQHPIIMRLTLCSL